MRTRGKPPEKEVVFLFRGTKNCTGSWLWKQGRIHRIRLRRCLPGAQERRRGFVWRLDQLGELFGRPHKRIRRSSGDSSDTGWTIVCYEVEVIDQRWIQEFVRRKINWRRRYCKQIALSTRPQIQKQRMDLLGKFPATHRGIKQP